MKFRPKYEEMRKTSVNIPSPNDVKIKFVFYFVCAYEVFACFSLFRGQKNDNIHNNNNNNNDLFFYILSSFLKLTITKCLHELMVLAMNKCHLLKKPHN